jgi:hypothetical protein
MYIYASNTLSARDMVCPLRASQGRESTHPGPLVWGAWRLLETNQEMPIPQLYLVKVLVGWNHE